MKRLGSLVVLALAVVLPSCASYHVPTMTAATQVVLDRDDIQILTDASGTSSAFSIFPFWLLSSSEERAMRGAAYRAIEAAYEKAGADFVLEPRTKTTYYNFLLFDYAVAEVVGKGVKINAAGNP